MSTPMAHGTKKLDAVQAIGDRHRVDRFAAPDELWEEPQTRFPALLASG
ncbi:MAG: hypothetical protein ACRELC_12600 [Gemmatimonadota bacterium]